MKKLLTISLLLLILSSVLGQTNFSVNQIPTIVYNDVSSSDVNNLNKEESISNIYVFGKPKKTDITFIENSNVIETDSGYFHSLTIEYENAVNLSLILSNYHLTGNDKLYIIGESEYFVFEEKNNTPTFRIGTPTLKGNRITLMLKSNNKPQIIIDKIIFGFRSDNYTEVSNKKDLKLNTSGDCHYDINCPEGNNWQDEKKGIVRISLGGFVCSGSMINNTNQDGSAYLLTANHCFAAFDDVSTWVFRFDYESSIPSCANANPSNEPSQPFYQIFGAELKSRSAYTDFCLLELFERPNNTIYYNGWEREQLPEGEVTTIHHPDGDVKKISGSTSTLTNEIYDGVSSIKVNKWDYGATEGGSSGSPLFNDDKKIVGALYGGLSSCSGIIPNNNEDYYGSFYDAWEGENNSKNRLKDWLDPMQSNVNSLPGTYVSISTLDAKITNVLVPEINCETDLLNPQVQVMNLGSTSITSLEYYIKSTLDSQYFSQDVNILSNKSAVITPDKAILIDNPYDTLQVVITKVNNTQDHISSNNSFVKPVISFLNTLKGSIDFITDCFGSESSWFLYNGNNRLITSGGPYTDALEAELISTPLCLPQDCYRLEILDSFDDGLTGGFVGCNNNGDVKVIINDTLRTLLTNVDFGSKVDISFCVNVPETPGDPDTPVFPVDPPPTIEPQNTISVYPNPFNDFLFIENQFDDKQTIEITTHNISGTLVSKETLTFTNLELKKILTGKLAPGIYFLTIVSENFNDKLKVVKY